MRDDRAPDALIADAAQAATPIFTAQRFRGIRVLAIDLSLSSISYAKRKTREMGITNIEFGHGGHSQAGSNRRTFDHQQSAGVAASYGDPFMDGEPCCPIATRGIMFWASIASSGAGASSRRVHHCRTRIFSAPADIRRFRQDVAEGNLE